ncbi:MAG: hypothetical protein ACD_20C00109G0013 [uncultured bacterium]|nr:MAG: hypothetical protein ACD_20C00109G0013 [uncultured bacterium]HBH17975.1 hypothetical protein [Cyanobacteria bacterium UBA9579]
MLKDILENKKCFKLICGAGNEDATEIEKLVALYAKAGANFFDLSANEEVIEAALRGLNRVIPAPELANYHLCISVGTKGDPHVSKAFIDKSKCIYCGNCTRACPQRAILSDIEYIVSETRCIGCGKCKTSCTVNAISFHSRIKPLKDLLSVIAKYNISCIELHASSNNEKEIYEKWQVINDNFDGMFSICLNRTHFGDIKLIELIKSLIESKEEFSTIVQTDGNPMSGSKDTYNATLQAISTAELVQNTHLPVFIIPSGGTNSKTAELAKLCKVNIHGVAIGSYARKIVREYIDREDFFENEEIFNKAVETAQKLVQRTFKDLVL